MRPFAVGLKSTYGSDRCPARFRRDRGHFGGARLRHPGRGPKRGSPRPALQGRREAVIRRPHTARRLISGCCVVAVTLLAPAARANVDPMLGVDQFSTLWTGTIHHVRTDDLSGMGAPGDFQKWDTTIT